jgi:hypothetical protein
MATKSMAVTVTSGDETNALISESVYELTTSRNPRLYNTVIPNRSASSGVVLYMFGCEERFLKSIEHGLLSLLVSRSSHGVYGVVFIFQMCQWPVTV